MKPGRLHAMIHRRIRYRVTSGGALFMLALALTGAGAFLSGNNLLFLVFAAMLALILVSGFISRLMLSGLELELLLPEHVSARMPTQARSTDSQSQTAYPVVFHRTRGSARLD